MQTRYDLLFQGQIASDCSPEDARRNLARLLRREPAEIEPLFSGKSYVLHHSLNSETAQHYYALLKQAGLICRLSQSSHQAPNNEASPATSSDQFLDKQTSRRLELASTDDQSPTSSPALEKVPSRKLELKFTDAGLDAQKSNVNPDGTTSTALNKCPKCGYKACDHNDPLIVKYNGLGECPKCGIIPKNYLKQQMERQGIANQSSKRVDNTIKENIKNKRSDNHKNSPIQTSQDERRKVEILSALIGVNVLIYFGIMMAYGVGVTDKEIAFVISIFFGMAATMQARRFLLSERGIDWLDHFGILVTINIALIVSPMVWHLWNSFGSENLSCTPSNFSERMLGCEPLDQQKLEATLMARAESRLSPTETLGQLVERQHQYHTQHQRYSDAIEELFLESSHPQTPKLLALLMRQQQMGRLKIQLTAQGFKIGLRRDEGWHIATEQGYEGVRSTF
ncbi:MAG: hypothetical protein P9E24_07895 [Candidatus Competibacter sp.]|nr:hypothetical protein [Candidatus Competibacter sp.]MDG4585222.1 hypothetical protein [Candidatus Competibacter sp.]